MGCYPKALKGRKPCGEFSETEMASKADGFNRVTPQDLNAKWASAIRAANQNQPSSCHSERGGGHEEPADFVEGGAAAFFGNIAADPGEADGLVLGDHAFPTL